MTERERASTADEGFASDCMRQPEVVISGFITADGSVARFIFDRRHLFSRYMAVSEASYAVRPLGRLTERPSNGFLHIKLQSLSTSPAIA